MKEPAVGWFVKPSYLIHISLLRNRTHWVRRTFEVLHSLVITRMLALSGVVPFDTNPVSFGLMHLSKVSDRAETPPIRQALSLVVNLHRFESLSCFGSDTKGKEK